MALDREFQKVWWRVRSYFDFVVPKVAVYGPFVTGNLGDEAALQAFAEISHCPPAIISSQTYCRIPSNLKALYCGFGGSFNGDTPKQFAKYFSAVRKRRFPTMLISAGINRDYDCSDYAKYDDAFRSFLKLFDYISVRDEHTKALVKRLGFGDVDVIPDLALTLGIDAPVSPAVRARKTVAVMLATHTGVVADHRKKVYEILAGALRELIEKDFRIVFVPFQNDTFSTKEKAVDEIEQAKQFVRETGLTQVEILDRPMNADEMLSYLLWNVSHVISMRPHGAVFAARCGLPSVILSYNEKHEAFAEMIGLPETVVPMWGAGFTEETIVRCFDRVDREYAKINGHLCARVAQLRVQATETLTRALGEVKKGGHI